MTTPRKRPPHKPPPEPPKKRSRLSSGFTSVRELLSYLIGAGTLIYGITAASSDKAIVVVGAGLALLGAPIVGSIFDKKDDR